MTVLLHCIGAREPNKFLFVSKFQALAQISNRHTFNNSYIQNIRVRYGYQINGSSVISIQQKDEYKHRHATTLFYVIKINQ
jgi:hypothetical protein